MSTTPHNQDELYDLPADFDDVLSEEWGEIWMRRRFLEAIRRYINRRGSESAGRPPRSPAHQDDASSAAAPSAEGIPGNLAGLALSGGGIRSATFCLGVLQELRTSGILPVFDYLSTVSGGGYLGGWWSGWLAREPSFVPADLTDPVGLLLRIFPLDSSIGEVDDRSAGSPDEVVLDAMPEADLLRLQALARRIRSQDLTIDDIGPGDRQGIIESFNRMLDQGELYERFSPMTSQGLQGLIDELRGLHLNPRGEESQGAAGHTRKGRKKRKKRAAGEELAWERCERALLNRLFLEELFPEYFERIEDPHRIIFPQNEGIEPDRYDSFLPAQGAAKPRRRGRSADKGRAAPPPVSDDPPHGGHNHDSSSAWFDPIHHLRLFANYLTPRKGSLSGDTWRAIAVISRNLVLTWLVLIPIFVALMICGQLYFLWHADTTGDFLPAVHRTTARTAPPAAGNRSGIVLPQPVHPDSARADGAAVVGNRAADSAATERAKHAVSSRGCSWSVWLLRPSR